MNGTWSQVQWKMREQWRASSSVSKNTERTRFLPHRDGWENGVKMEIWRTVWRRHFLRGPSGATGSSTPSIQVSIWTALGYRQKSTLQVVQPWVFRHLEVRVFAVKQDKSRRVTAMNRFDQGHLHPKLKVPRMPPWWEVSTLEKSHTNSWLMLLGTSTYEHTTRAIVTPGSGSALRIQVRIQQLKLIRRLSKSGSLILVVVCK